MKLQQVIDRTTGAGVALDLLIDIGENKGMVLERDGDRYRFVFHYERVHPATADFLQHVIGKDNNAGLCEVYCLSNLFAHGIKSFNVDARVFESFEHYELNVYPEDYHQPFKTFVIDLPEEFCEKHRVKDAHGIVQTPQVAIFHYDKEFGSLHVVIALDNQFHLTFHMDFNKPGMTLEQIIVEHRGQKLSGMQLSEEESVLTEQVIRAGINLCLMATNYGMRELGPANASHYTRTKERLDKAVRRKDRELAETNRRALIKIPFCYGFTQSTPLFRTIGYGERGEGQGTGSHVTPHWRKGHWRRHRYGKGLTETKVIAIPAVMVNADLVLGGEGATSAEYKG